MEDIRKSILGNFGNKLRVRVCGICVDDEKILMVNHHSLNKSGDFWAPPGGGMDFGESAEETLKREFLEETGLKVEIDKFLFVHEYLSPPLHAIELIYKVNLIDGKLKIGFDPEMKSNQQIIKDVQFISFSEIKNIEKESVHQLFEQIDQLIDLNDINGYFRYEKRA